MVDYKSERTDPAQAIIRPNCKQQDELINQTQKRFNLYFLQLGWLELNL